MLSTSSGSGRQEENNDGSTRCDRKMQLLQIRASADRLPLREGRKRELRGMLGGVMVVSKFKTVADEREQSE
jgi:hypothetical protein